MLIILIYRLWTDSGLYVILYCIKFNFIGAYMKKLPKKERERIDE